MLVDAVAASTGATSHVTDRRPPHNPEAEESLLGAMLLMDQARRVGLDMVSAPDFHDPRHQAIFSAIAGRHAAGKDIDEGLVADTLAELGYPEIDRQVLLNLSGSMPPSAHTRGYADIVADDAYLRRAIKWAGEIEDRAYEGKVEPVAQLLGAVDETLAVPVIADTSGLEDVGDVAAKPREPKAMVIPGLLGERERVGLSSSGGVGKSTLLRQINVMVASGIHPFTWEPITPRRGLHVDMENEEEDTDAEARTGYVDLVKVAGSRYRGGAMRVTRTQGIDLRARRDVRWLEAQIRAARPSLLLIGPVYKMYRGQPGSGKFSDEAVDEVIGALDELRKRYNLALIIEGHSPYGTDGDRAGGRWKGSQEWEAWLNFARTLRIPDKSTGREDNGTDVDVVPWRFDRHEGRTWPRRLVHGESWPWERPNMTDPSLGFE